MRVVWLASRVLFGAVFVYAGTSKVADAQQFAQMVFNYQILPGMLVNAVALVLPAVEVVAGLALVLGVLTRGAAVILNVLMAVFMAALGAAVLRGIDVACGCFGAGGDAVTAETLARDAAIWAVGLVALWGAFASKKPKVVAPAAAPAPGPARQPAA